MSLTKLQSQSIDTNITLTGVITATSFSGNPLIFETNNVERARITSDGKFAIGTQSPAYILDVVGDSNSNFSKRIRNNNTGGSAQAVQILSAAGRDVSYAVSYIGQFAVEQGSSVPTKYTDFDNHIWRSSAGSERARIDSSGRLLVGTSSSRAVGGFTPHLLLEGIDANSSTFSVVRNNNAPGWPQIILAKTRGTAAGGVGLVVANDRLGEINFAGGDGTTSNSVGASIFCDVDGTPGTNDMPGRIVLSTTADGSSSPTERVRIDSAGSAMFGGGGFGTQGSLSVRPNYATGSGNFIAATPLVYWNRTSSTSVGTACLFQNTGVTVGSITYTNTATAYNTSSDYRLKENIVPLTGAVDRLKLIPVHRFNFIADPSKTVDGFLAHEAQAVVPECVTGTKDEVDDEGNPVYQGIDQSKLVPLLTAALQEALDEIESLKARLTAAGI